MTDAHVGLLSRIPIWVRISAIIALVLVGVVVAAKVLGNTSVADRGDHMQQPGMQTDMPGHTPPPGGGH